MAAHLHPIKYYLQKRRHTVYDIIRGRGVLMECEGAKRRRGTLPRLFWVEQDMAVPERRVYEVEGGGSGPPPAAAHVTPQARPMPEFDGEAHARWLAAHIND